MTDGPEGNETSEPQGGVFGKLPASRPGTRSPRRGGGEAAESPAAAKAKTAEPAPPPAPAPEPAAEPTAGPEPVRARAEAPAAAPDEQGREGGGGIEDLAWAGIAAAAEAATLGVRLASRAMGAVRDSVDRR